MLTLILPLLWLVLIIWGLKFNKQPLPGAPLSKDQSQAIRGICALAIILCHFSMYTFSKALFPLRKCAILFVGIFFLLSGYGTALGFEKKENYGRLFVIKKMLRLFIPAYLAFVINKIHLYILYPNVCHFYDLLKPVVFLKDINWFIYELFAMYVVAYICEKLGGLKKMQWIIWVFSLLFLGTVYLQALEEPWYGCTICFPLGVAYYHYKDKFDNLIFRKRPIINSIILLVCIAAFSLCYFVIYKRIAIVGVIGRNLASASFCLFVMLLLTYFTVGNKLSAWFGNISFELYLYHIPVLELALFNIDNELIMGLVTVAGSVVLAVIMKIIWQVLFGPVTSKKVNNDINQ